LADSLGGNIQIDSNFAEGSRGLAVEAMFTLNDEAFAIA
jgi:hypothetical protein